MDTNDRNTLGKWPAVMLDLETGGTGDDAAILEIGAVALDPDQGLLGPTFFRAVELESNDRAGRRFTGGTMAWWLRRWRSWQSGLPDPDAGVPVLAAAAAAADFIADHLADAGEVWSKGNFDLPILDHALQQAQVRRPWEYWQARDLRTVMAWEAEGKPKSIAHRALDDALDQARCLIRMRIFRLSMGMPAEERREA